jgi:hypothetical protein
VFTPKSQHSQGLIDLSTLSQKDISQIIQTYFESICTNSQPTHIIDLIEYILALNQVDIVELCEIIKNYTKSYLINIKKKLLGEIAKYNKLTNLNNFLIDYIQISEFLNIILERYTKLFNLQNIITIRINQLSEIILSDIKIVKYICEVFLTEGHKNDIVNLFDILNQISIYDEYKIVTNIIKNISCFCKQQLLEMSYTLLFSDFQSIQNIENSVQKYYKIKRDYPFMSTCMITTQQSQNDSSHIQQSIKSLPRVKSYVPEPTQNESFYVPESVITPTDNTVTQSYFDIITEPIYNYILENILSLLLSKSPTLEHVLDVFNNYYYFLDKYIHSSIYYETITNISHALPPFIGKILETISEVESTTSLFALLEYVYKIINNKTDTGRVKAHICAFVSIIENTDLLIETIHTLILQPDTCSNYKLNIIIRIIEYLPTSNITFIDKYYQLLSQRLIHNINIKNKEVFNNYIRMEYHIWHLCKNKIHIQQFIRMVRIIDTMIEDTSVSYNNCLLDTKVLITSYGAWQIQNISCITTSKSIQDVNTPLAHILKYHSEKYSEINTNKTIDWLLQYGQVVIIYKEKEITMQPIQLLLLELFKDFKYIIKNVRLAGIGVMNIEGIQTCLICQDNLNSIDYTDINNKITNIKGGCGHVFHNDCIKTWLAHNRKCPLCREEWQYNTN